MFTYFLLINRLRINSISNEFLEQGDSLLLKLESGKVLTLYAKSRISPVQAISNNKAIGTIYISTYPIPNEDLKLMATEKTIYIRINVGPLVFDNEMIEKAIPKLQNAANCILQ